MLRQTRYCQQSFRSSRKLSTEDSDYVFRDDCRFMLGSRYCGVFGTVPEWLDKHCGFRPPSDMLLTLLLRSRSSEPMWHVSRGAKLFENAVIDLRVRFALVQSNLLNGAFVPKPLFPSRKLQDSQLMFRYFHPKSANDRTSLP
jgi:hypothetical protein